jgi:hypothetical protein
MQEQSPRTDGETNILARIYVRLGVGRKPALFLFATCLVSMGRAGKKPDSILSIVERRATLTRWDEASV